MTRARIAILNFHPAFTPPRSGGELRYHHLSTQLARAFDVKLVNPTFSEAVHETVEHAPHCVEVRVPKHRAYHAWHRFFDRVAGFAECSALVATLAGRSHRSWRAEAERAAVEADVLVFSSPFMAPAMPRRKPGQLLVYDAYNVEARLAKEVLGDRFWGRWGARRIARIEGRLAREADLVLVCSREDAEEMQALHGVSGDSILVVPNGVDASAVQPPDEHQRSAAGAAMGWTSVRPVAVFLGSNHPPNVDAARFLVHIAPECPGVDFVIAGRCGEALDTDTLPTNVRVTGMLDDTQRAQLLAGADVALNPMAQGSGTNLKMLEFLAAGLPTLTTPIGARGLELVHGEHAMIVERAFFVAGVRDLVRDVERQETLRRIGRAVAESRYAWERIGGKLVDVITHQLTPRVVLLNDYPVTPVRAGGQVRLEAVAREISAADVPMTIVTLTKHGGRRGFLAAGCEEVCVPRSDWHNRIDRVLGGWMGVAVDDVTALVAWRLTPRLAHVLRRIGPRARLVVLSHIYMAGAAAVLPRELPRVYESHNVETRLKDALFGGSAIGRWMVRAVRRAETRALQTSHAVTCVSSEDRAAFVADFGAPAERLVVAGNGVMCAARGSTPAAQRPVLRRAMGLGEEPTALFVGSGHPPNRDAVRFVCEELAPALPEATFVVAGSVCGWFRGARVPWNVVMMGPVEDATKELLLQAADVALNPVFAGSGSSLKVPEALSAGLPVVSSDVGARGFTNGATPTGMIVGEREGLAAALSALLEDAPQRERLAREARRYAEEHHDWSVTLAPLVAVVREHALR